MAFGDRGLTGSRGRVKSPTDLNDRSILDKIASDASMLAANLPRALATMAGAPISDTVGRAARAAAGEDASYPSQTVEQLVLPWGESFANTASLANPKQWDRHADEFSSHPLLTTIEHVGNVAITGSAVSQPLKASARRAAGMSAKGLNRTQRAAQLAEIADSGGVGSATARAAQISGDLVGHPYRRAGRAAIDARLPGGSASLRETFQQVREGAPTAEWTPAMRDAAELRRLRGDVEMLREQAGEVGRVGDEAQASDVAGRLAEAEANLTRFEETHAADLATLEGTRLTPMSPDDMTPLASTMRGVADSDFGQWVGQRVGGPQRAVRKSVQDLNEDVTKSSMEVMATRDPAARRNVAIRNLRLLRREMPEAMEAAGIHLPRGTALGRMDDADLLRTLEAVRDNPELRGALPNLESTLDLSILDTYERVAGLPEGALRNRLYDDQTLTPEVAERLRDLNRKRRDLDATPGEPAPRTPGVAEGNVRMYRAEGAERVARTDIPEAAAARQGRHFTPDRATAEQYLTDGRRLEYVDVPAHVARQAGDDPWSAMREATDGAQEAVLPDEWASQARRLDEGADPGDAARAIDDALGESYRVPDEQLDVDFDALPESVQRSYAGARHQLTKEAAERDLILAEKGLGDPDAWALRVEQMEGRWRALDPTENPELKITPSSAQAKRLKAMGRKIKALRTTATRMAERASKGMWEERGGVSDSYRSMRRQIDSTARALDEARLPREVAGPMLDELNKLADELSAAMDASGYSLPESLVNSQARIQRAANLGERGDPSDAARAARNTGRGFEDRLLRDQTKARMNQRQFEQANQRVQRAEEAFAAVEAEMRASLDAAPSVARPMLQVTRSMEQLDTRLREIGATELADELDLQGLPQLLEEINAATESPVYLGRMEVREAAAGTRNAEQSHLRAGRMGSQRRREMTDMEVNRDIDRVKAERDIELISNIMSRETAGQVQKRFGKTMDELGEQAIESGLLNREAWRDMTKHQKEKLLTDELGYNVYAPEEHFVFKGRRTNETESVWIPKSLDDALTRYRTDNTFESAVKNFLAPATQTWKTAILALRPAWHLYNIIGNAAMSIVKGRVSPLDYIDFMRPGGQAREMLRRYKLGWDMSEYGMTPGMADDLFEGGLSRDLAPHESKRVTVTQGLRDRESVKRLLDSPANERISKLKSGLGTLSSASYRVNAMFDNMNRATVYLDTMQQGGSPRAGLVAAKEALGDYTTMTPFEKTYVRTAFPFYAWMRHITKLTATMLRPDDITRATIFGQVINTLGDPQGAEQDLPGYAAGDLQIPGTDKFLGTRGLNPWQDVFDPIVYNDELSTRGLARSMNPLAQMGIERATGIDTLTGRPFSRPVPVLDDLGREVPTAPPLGEHLFQSVAPPQATLMRDAARKATGETTARYSTGDPVTIEGAREPSTLAGLGSFFGLPIRDPNLEDIQERRENAMDRVGRQIERYNEEVEEHEAGRGGLRSLLPGG